MQHPPATTNRAQPRVAIYARYSSDKQSEASIEDQVESCRRDALSKGWHVVGIYSDAAVSGKTSQKRPQYLQLVADADRGLFDIVLAEAVDRLSRRLADVASLLDRLSFQKIRLFTVSQGELSPLMAGVMGAVAQGFLDDLRHKTRRGQRGRTLAGFTAGGIGYGYRVVPEEKGKRLIEPTEAAVVRRIFEMYGSGVSPLAIAKRLNEEGIRGPKGKNWSDTSIRGQTDRGTGILNNLAYLGQLAWDRCSYVVNPITGNRVARPRPETEWEITDAPELRIVDDELWRRVKERQAAVKTIIGRDLRGNALNRAHRQKHFLSGLLVCGRCGGQFIVLDGYRYGCSTRKSKGTCDNHHKVRRTEIEARVLEGLKHQLLQPEFITNAIDGYKSALESVRSETHIQNAALARRAKNLNRQIGNIVEAIADGRQSPALLAKLAALESDNAKIQVELANSETERFDDVPQFDAERISAIHRMLVDEYLDVLLDPEQNAPEDDPDAAEVREMLRGMIEKITLTPSPDNEQLEAVLEGAFAGLIAAAVNAQSIESKSPSENSEGLETSVVAGAGFEPAAFRL